MACGKNNTVGSTVNTVFRAKKDIQDVGADEECPDCTTSCFMEPLGDC